MIATDDLRGGDLLGELRRHLRHPDTEVMVIAPAVEKTAFRHALGDVDTAVSEARRRLEMSLTELRRAGVHALGEVGDSDPLLAAKDALRRYPADEVLIVARAEGHARWFEDGLFERARVELYPPLCWISIDSEDGDAEPHLAGVKEVSAGREHRSGAEREPALSSNLPPLARSDLLGILVAIVGTIAAIVLAAAGPGPGSPAGAAQILVAMAVTLINLAHVVGLTLLESVGDRSGWQRFFHDLSAVGTPLAVLVNAAIVVLG